MRKITLFHLIFYVFFTACNEGSEIKIEAFYSQTSIVKNNEGTKSIFFLVTGYSGSDNNYEQIEKHVCSINRDSLFLIYRQFWLSYYRKSEKTNNKNIAANPKDFFNHSTFEDQIAEYSFSQISLVLRRKYFLQEYERDTDFFKENELCE